MDKIRILASDTATISTGYAILDIDPKEKDFWKSISLIKYGKIVISPYKKTFLKRIPEIYFEFKTIFNTYFPIQELAIEDIFVGKNVQTSLTLGKIHGIVLALASEQGSSITYYNPTKIKKVICNDASAKKGQIIRAVNSKFRTNFNIDDNDIADAVAIGVTRAADLIWSTKKR